MIIGIAGFQGAGKDTVADYLQNIYGFKRDSFAATLKDAVAAVFGWDRELLEGRTKESRIWREQVDPWWANRLNMPNLTPRLVLQKWGTEVARKSWHDDTWIASLENKLNRAHNDIVITDVRFPNEIQAVRNAGGIVIRVVRGPEPDWYATALGANAGILPDQELLKQLGVHPSEWAWIGTNFDAVLDNNANGLDNLYKQINELVKHLESNLLVSKVNQTA
jgi:rhodanese-related sulfurtransferase